MARVRPSVLKLGRRDARAREARAADPRAPVEAETRVTGRPAAPARYALSFMFPRILRALTSQLCGVDCRRLRSLHFFKNADYLVTIGSRMRGVNARCLMIPADGDLSDCDHSLLKRALLTNEAVLRV